MATILNKYDLSKTRYTHRDYDSIKADLIAAIPSLTQEWTSREESDPGIVLIKLMSMFGDTLSYNVDKIALELYIESVTQRKNCSKILRLLGYKMHWYRAARVTAHVKLKSSDSPVTAIFRAYETEFRAGTVSYVMTDKIVDETADDSIIINSPTSTKSVDLIQGRAMKIQFSQGELVNNRYYLGSINVDEKELRLSFGGRKFILTDNLYLVSSSTEVYYEFDVDEYDRPYIKLADNWQDIIDSSDDTKFDLIYIINDGSFGNITSNAFTVVTSMSGSASSNDLVITNLANTTNYGDDGQSLDEYNSSGYDPQTVDDARLESANYVLTHDTLVTSSDYEKATKRNAGITVSKMVDSQVVSNDDLDLATIINRADDDFDNGSGGLKLAQVILYLGYLNFDKEYNHYWTDHNSPYTIYVAPTPQDPDPDPYWIDNQTIYEDLGYYPYRITDNIQQTVRNSINSLQTLNVIVDFGTLKLFPFKVKGTLHLVEPRSPQECLQIIDQVNSALTQAYYPSLHPVGEQPDFIELVNIIQNSDVRIKYFDAIGNIVEWAPSIDLDHFDENFDTTSAVMYNGLSDSFTLSKKFLSFRLKNVGVSDTSHGDGTAYLVNYSGLHAPSDPVVTIAVGAINTIQCSNIAELKALCDDMGLVGSTTIEGQTVDFNNTGLQWTEG